MKSIKVSMLIIITAVILFMFSSCKIGSSYYTNPEEIDKNYQYCVIYDAMGGTISTLKTRTAFYSEGSLIKEPGGEAGMLNKPVNGNKVVSGWYTSFKNSGTKENPVYIFNEQDRWNFGTDRIGQKNTAQKTLTLYARWTSPPTVCFVDADAPDTVLYRWEDVLADKGLSRPTATVPESLEKEKDGLKSSYTLLDYYYDAGCTEKVKWGDESLAIRELISEQNNNTITIYCKYIEGSYIRINNATELKGITDFGGKYILANDIDLSNTEWTTLTGKEPFSGIFLGNGYTISGLTFSAANRTSALEKKTEKSYGMFSVLSGATFKNLNFLNVTIKIGFQSNTQLCTGVFGGRATETVFENCTIHNYTILSDGDVKTKVFLGTAAFTDNTCSVRNCSFEQPDTAGLTVADKKLLTGPQPSVTDQD